jgi:hypothetical protein
LNRTFSALFSMEFIGQQTTPPQGNLLSVFDLVVFTAS